MEIRINDVSIKVQKRTVIAKTKKAPNFLDAFLWIQLGLNQRPPDYESGATNQLSYGSVSLFVTANAAKAVATTNIVIIFIYIKIKL